MNAARSFLTLVSCIESDGIGTHPPGLPGKQPLQDVFLGYITMKTIGLISLATAHRAQTFSLINVRDIVEKESGTEFKIHSPIKTSKPGVRHASISVAAAGGLSLDQIRLKAVWSPSSSVFPNVYNRPKLGFKINEFTIDGCIRRAK
ncbi:unnamed protein product [Allacma fusca]|uniref:Uncharacterized protein n=1 Tax=Allacma fusca TaxID=39272 RepID=A0A8J2PN96_9HEXA|nr:unnamed protein product [Allacma fusca]